MKRAEGGFTLIEMLIVIGVLAILAAIVIIAINPAEQFAQARDAQRKSDVKVILNAVQQNIIANRGIWDCSGYPLPADNTPIASTDLDICSCLVSDFIAALPADPKVSNSYFINCIGAYNTGYVLRQDSSNGRLTISSTGELIVDISVTQ